MLSINNVEAPHYETFKPLPQLILICPQTLEKQLISYTRQRESLKIPLQQYNKGVLSILQNNIPRITSPVECFLYLTSTGSLC